MNREPFVTGEYYHVFNRGVDKREVFDDEFDVLRFYQSLVEFRPRDPIGSLYELSFKDQLGGSTAKCGPKVKNLVDIVAYCLNPNHYHLILKQNIDGGISEFMKRVNGGYTWYYNNECRRSGSLFQGRFKSVFVSTNEYLLYLSVYVNLNFKVHQLANGSKTLPKFFRSSWESYTRSGSKDKKKEAVLENDIVLGQFTKPKKYELYASNLLPTIVNRKRMIKDLAMLFVDE